MRTDAPARLAGQSARPRPSRPRPVSDHITLVARGSNGDQRMTSVPPVEPDLEWCHDAVQGVSRTFALTVDVLEEPMSSHVCLGISSAASPTPSRTPATSPGRTGSTVTDVRRRPRPGRRRDDDRVPVGRRGVATRTSGPQRRLVGRRPVAHHLGDLRRPARASPRRRRPAGPGDGRRMAMFVDRHADVGGLRIDDRSELEEYCYYAAGTVGTLITNLLTRGEISRERARHPGNRRGVRSVAPAGQRLEGRLRRLHRGEQRLPPRRVARRRGIDQDAVVDPDNRKPAARVVHRTASHASTFLDDAQAYLEAMPLAHGNTVSAWSVPYLLGVGTPGNSGRGRKTR